MSGASIHIPDSTHDWYDFVYAYDASVITTLLEQLDVTTNDLVYDPFTGTGTTVLTCKQHGVDAIGTDTSPASTLAASVKTTWNINLTELDDRVTTLLTTLRPALQALTAANKTTLQDYTNEAIIPPVPLDTYDFTQPDTLPDGWLHELTWKHINVIKHHINTHPDDVITDVFKLALMSILPESLANIRFAPEVTRVDADPSHVDAYTPFKNKLTSIQSDIRCIQRAVQTSSVTSGRTDILQADARNTRDALINDSCVLTDHGAVDYIITSPPYPAEHDYTRNQRLELLSLDHCWTTEQLQTLKKQNIRSHTKNIYTDDTHGETVAVHDNNTIHEIVSEMRDIIEKENVTHGFGQAYPRVVEEYFGDMVLHLRSAASLLSDTGTAAYVVADSGSYWQVEIPTSDILHDLALDKTPFSTANTMHWRDITATTAEYSHVNENILLLSK